MDCLVGDWIPVRGVRGWSADSEFNWFTLPRLSDPGIQSEGEGGVWVFRRSSFVKSNGVIEWVWMRTA